MSDELFIHKPGTRNSWHLFRTWTRVPGNARTVCDRSIMNPEEHTGTPAGKTCESCFRIKASGQTI